MNFYVVQTNRFKNSDLNRSVLIGSCFSSFQDAKDALDARLLEHSRRRLIPEGESPSGLLGTSLHIHAGSEYDPAIGVPPVSISTIIIHNTRTGNTAHIDCKELTLMDQGEVDEWIAETFPAPPEPVIAEPVGE